MTRVLPDPAPARTSCGPSPCVTAEICSGLSCLSSSSETACFTPEVCPRGWGDGKAGLRRDSVLPYAPKFAVGAASGDLILGKTPLGNHAAGVHRNRPEVL